ncbi:MAG: MmgE/PrpD family protein [Victivallaceae bacterium]|nr:MmgE/PrpD family protein [Victivallaceae bacterium]
MEKAHSLFIDATACIYAGNTAAAVKELIQITRSFGGAPDCSIIGFNLKTSPTQAAFLNSVMAHARDYDDTHDPAVHHGCVTIIPAMLAVCEKLRRENKKFRISGQEFFAALAVGLDIADRMGLAFIRHLHTGWLPTTLWGAFGCAAACGRLMNFSSDEMLKAFGAAYSMVHGNRQALIDGALTKRIQPGISAEAGVKSVFWARAGISGAENIIDGDYGIPALYTGGKIDREFLTEKLGVEFETLNISVKPYPCCRCTHPVIDAVRLLKTEHSLCLDDIQSGKIFLPPKGMGQIGKPFQIRGNPTVDAQFSAQYTAALALVTDKIRIDDFSAQSILSRKEIAIAAAEFEVVESFKDFPGLVPVKVMLKLKTGKRIGKQLEYPLGSPMNPMTQEQIQLKFHDCLSHAARRISPEIRNRMLETLYALKNKDDILPVMETVFMVH